MAAVTSVSPSPGPVAQGVVPNGAPAAAYTVPALTTFTPKQASFVNNSGGPLTLTLWINGTAAGNQILDAQPIADKQTYIALPLLNQNIGPAGTIQWEASGAGITGTISGILTI